jgi:hypothetical protein
MLNSPGRIATPSPQHHEEDSGPEASQTRFRHLCTVWLHSANSTLSSRNTSAGKHTSTMSIASHWSDYFYLFVSLVHWASFGVRHGKLRGTNVLYFSFLRYSLAASNWLLRDSKAWPTIEFYRHEALMDCRIGAYECSGQHRFISFLGESSSVIPEDGQSHSKGLSRRVSAFLASSRT